MKHTIQVHMTNSCNLKCEYCYIKQNSLSLTQDVLEQQLAKVKELSYMLSGCDCEYDVTYFGGEPLLKIDNVLKFDEYICDNFDVCHKFMQTNGMLLTKAIKEKLDDRKINIGISCDGCNDPNHKEVERLYREKIIHMHPKMMVDGYNVGSLMENIKYFFDMAIRTQCRDFYIDASFVKDKVWNKKSLEILKTQLDELNDFILWVYKNYNYYLKIGFLDRVLQNIIKGKRDFICFAGSTGFSITPTGVIYPCSRFYSANEYPLYDSNRNEFFYDNIDFIKKNNITKNEKCNECAINKYCNQGCYYSQIKNGGIIDEYCEVQKIAFHKVTELYKKFRKFYNIDITRM